LWFLSCINLLDCYFHQIETMVCRVYVLCISYDEIHVCWAYLVVYIGVGGIEHLTRLCKHLRITLQQNNSNSTSCGWCIGVIFGYKAFHSGADWTQYRCLFRFVTNLWHFGKV
jgi:hypothetical protein